MPRYEWIAYGFAVLVIALLAFCHPADSHDAPTGWSYPTECCSGLDCREVTDSALKETNEGYVTPAGEVIPYSSPKIRNSPDGRFHWCSVMGKEDSRTICLFVPPRSF